MSREKFFLDTSFVQGLLNPNDQYAVLANALYSRMQAAKVVRVTETVLTEIGDGLSAINRQAASNFIDQCYSSHNITIVTVDSILFKRGLELYRRRSDKDWGLTDCISFVVMQDYKLNVALTSDKHFVQAGYRALLLEE